MHKLIHYSANSEITYHSTVQKAEDRCKPSGLWISVEDDYGWADYCRSVDCYIKTLEYSFKIELNPTAHILELRNYANLIAFTEEYKIDDRNGRNKRISNIDWIKIAEIYDGIIIAPLRNYASINTALDWHSSWDCSSGCMWGEQALFVNKLERNLEYENQQQEMNNEYS